MTLSPDSVGFSGDEARLHGRARNRVIGTKLPQPDASRRKRCRFPKTDVRYWREAVATAPGTRIYRMRVMVDGRRVGISLRTTNREEAAKRACEI